MDLDQSNTAQSLSFGEVAREYDRLRSAPSEEALDWLVPANAADVLEIGAGTGILTRLLTKRVARVTAVEPDARMRDVLSASGTDIEVLSASAEEMPVSSSSFDLVIAQSAWHWVDERRAIPEVARVLRPGGRFSVVWTGPDRSIDWMRSLWAAGIIFSPELDAEADRRRRGRYVVNVDIAGDSPFLEPETRLFQWSRPMTKPDLVALAATYSAVITMEGTARRKHLEEMKRLLDGQEEFRGLDVIEVPIRSYCWRAVKR